MMVSMSDEKIQRQNPPLNREMLDVEKLKRELANLGPCAFVDVVEETGSTNTDLAERLRGTVKGGSAFGVLLADHQTAGKGRMGRSFGAPPRTMLILSMVIVPGAERLEQVGTLSLAAGLALIDVLGSSSGASLKWPNDVLINGKKMCGILAEGVDIGTDDPAIVMGLGLNVDLTEQELPVPHASSLRLQGITVDRTDLAISVITRLVARIEQWRDDHEQLIEDYRGACSSLGEQVRVHLPGEKILEGVARDVTSQGHIVVAEGADGAGPRHELCVGDVVHLRLNQQWQY